ncbi:MAG: hypothetical protein AAF668_11710 [Pseudomonadota bacterium]
MANAFSIGLTTDSLTELRGTAVTRPASVGCSIPQIGSITGHSINQISAILEKHYLSHDQAPAEEGIRKFETGIKTPNWTSKSKSSEGETI